MIWWKLEGGNRGYGSKGRNEGQSEVVEELKIKSKLSVASQRSIEDVENEMKIVTKPIHNKKKRFELAQTRKIISARQLQKLAKNNNPVFLIIVKKWIKIPKREEKGK